MKKLFLLLLILPLFGFTPEWGKVGHRTVGEIAQRHLTPEATSAVFELLDGESLSSASTWADEMRSNPDFDIYSNWHYVNLPLDKNYGEVEHKDRDTQLRRLAQIPGVYVPRFYAFTYYDSDGTISNVEPLVEEAESHIVKRITPLMPPPVTRFVVPFES